MRERNVFVVPTLGLGHSLCGQTRGPGVLDDAQLAAFIATEARNSLQERFLFPPVQCRDLLDEVRKLHEAGIVVLAGTDAPMPGLGHGASLHDELVLGFH
jgi:hypothetical protein